MDTEQRALRSREARLRRMAARQRLRLRKSPRRDPYAWDYSTYDLVDAETGHLVAAEFETGRPFGLSLDQIEEWLTKGKEGTR